MGLFHREKPETDSKLDADVEREIKKYPKKIRSKLRGLYKDYKDGKLIFPEGFDKKKFLKKINKE